MTPVQPLPAAKSETRLWGIVSAILYFVLYMGISFGMAVGLSIFVAALYPDEASQLAAFDQYSNLLMIIVDVLVVLILSVIVLASGKRYFHGMGMRKSRIETIPVAFISGVGLSCVLSIVMTFVEMIFPKLMEDYNQTMETSYNMGQIVLYILAGVIGAPLVEELIFRHFMAGNLTRGLPRWLTILLTSVVFGAVHGHIVQIAYAALLGIVMACLYFAYDSVLPSIALHAGFNSLSLLSLLDPSKWSEKARNLYETSTTIMIFALAAVSIVGLAWMFVRKTHRVWKNEPMALQAEEAYEYIPRPTAVEWESLLATPRVQGSFPTVAELSANMKAKAEAEDAKVNDGAKSVETAEEVGE